MISNDADGRIHEIDLHDSLSELPNKYLFVVDWFESFPILIIFRSNWLWDLKDRFIINKSNINGNLISPITEEFLLV